VYDKLVSWQIWKRFGFFVASLRGIRKLFQSPARRTPPAVVQHYENDTFMKYFTTIFFTILTISTIAQTRIYYEKLHKELIELNESAFITIFSERLENLSKFNSISLISDNWLTEPPVIGLKPSEYLNAEIITKQSQKDSIIQYLEKNNYLTKLYLRTNLCFTNVVDGKDSFNSIDPFVIIEIFHSYEKSMIQTYVPINNLNEAIKIINDLSLFFDKKEKYFFKRFSKDLKNLQ
jgi:hypothetical protein